MPTIAPDDPKLLEFLARRRAWDALTDGQRNAHFVPPSAPTTPARPGPPRVALWCPVLVFGGAEAVQLAMARHIKGVEWAECVVTQGENHTHPGMARAFREIMPVTFGLAAARESASRSDLIISWAIPGMESILSGLSPRPKIISIAHAPADSEWGQSIYRQSAGADHFVAVSELALDAMPPEARARSSVIWNAVDTAKMAARRSRAEVRASWVVPPDAPVAGYMGRFSDEKDPFAMIRLARSLPDPWHVVVVGDGFERGNMEAELRRDPCPRVHLVGADPATGDVLNAMDVLVVPSRFESFGLSIAEGLWAGVPVVSTRVGIAKLRTGLTHEVPVGAGGSTLAAAVVVAKAIGPAPGSGEWAREHLAPDRFAREWEALIARVVPTAKAPTPTPGLERDIRLMKLRRECPSGSRPAEGCGCSDELDCSRLGRRVGRRECYACLESEDHPPRAVDPGDHDARPEPESQPDQAGPVRVPDPDLVGAPGHLAAVVPGGPEGVVPAGPQPQPAPDRDVHAGLVPVHQGGERHGAQGDDQHQVPDG